mgnify:CR=1 FL=1
MAPCPHGSGEKIRLELVPSDILWQFERSDPLVPSSAVIITDISLPPLYNRNLLWRESVEFIDKLVNLLF